MKNEILASAKKLKNCNDPFNKVFVNKDLHPVYLNENKRIKKTNG